MAPPSPASVSASFPDNSLFRVASPIPLQAIAQDGKGKATLNTDF